VLNDANYIVGAGADTRVSVGAFLEVLVAIACSGTAPPLVRGNVEDRWTLT
jgi:hypothetical protein